MVDDFRSAFDLQVKLLLSSKNPEGCTIIPFVERSLAQFNLTDSHNSIEVINEAYLRGRRLIKNGERIDNPLAWIRVTSYNIIREYSRERKKFSYLEESWVEDKVDLNLVPNEEILSEFKRVNLAFNRLNEQDRELLQLKVIENLTWREIIKYLTKKGVFIDNEPKLRKRKHRALKMLRKIYHSLKKADTDNHEIA
ncbi:MAG: sigma-70 family RNA polymerase sigma factor [Cyanobacteriota bacterium]|nr:sigma-70 family RNA polymerase sigma factor [Cyanobacteriota bacterium]